MELKQCAALMANLSNGLPDVEDVVEVAPGHWTIGLADESSLIAEYLVGPPRVALSTLVGKPPIDRRFTVYESLLAYNSLWRENDGARLALDGAGGEAMLVLDLPLPPSLTQAELDAALAAYLELADLWCQYVTAEAEQLVLPPRSPVLMTMMA